MIEFLIYDAKVAVLIAVFYMFYRLMLARETFHRVNRVVLLLTAVSSFVLPLCVITMHETVTMEMPVVAMGDVEMGTAPMDESIAQTSWWQIVLPILFVIGMVATLTHTLVSMFRILMLIKRSEKHPQPDGITICVISPLLQEGRGEVISPFSWMHFIVMNQSDYAERNAAILAHERGHIRLKHSWDLLLVDTLTALQWFNPAMWMLRSDLRAIHEYEADGAVLSLGINARQYQYLLITKAAGIGGYSLANGINHSTLKNRINMMLHKKSNQTRLFKLLALVPIVAVALAVNAEKVQDVVYTDAITSATENTTVEQAMPEVTPEANPAATPEAPTLPKEMQQEDEKVNIKVHVSAKEDGSPIVGAVAQVVGTKKGSVSDFDGNFTLEANVGSRVEVSYIGYDTEIITVKKDNSQNYEVVLAKESVAKNDDDPKAYEDTSKSSDVVVEVGDGDQKPDKEPYIIVDGSPIDNSKLKEIDPKTIDHMDVLKDKSAVEMYGEKAKYGAIIITTKKK